MKCSWGPRRPTEIKHVGVAGFLDSFSSALGCSPLVVSALPASPALLQLLPLPGHASPGKRRVNLRNLDEFTDSENFLYEKLMECRKLGTAAESVINALKFSNWADGLKQIKACWKTYCLFTWAQAGLDLVTGCNPAWKAWNKLGHWVSILQSMSSLGCFFTNF
jgi:hypothetical protein